MLNEIENKRGQLEKLAANSVEDKKNMRAEMGDLENDLRRIRDKLAEVEIENQSYQCLADAEKQLREARCAAELAAAKSVNQDL